MLHSPCVPRRKLASPNNKVIRLTFSAPLIEIMEKECRILDMELGAFLRAIIRTQQGTPGVLVRSARAPRPAPLSTAKSSSGQVNLYLSQEMLDFLQGLANSCGTTKKGVLSTAMLDYFDILPLRLGNAKPLS